MRSARSSWLEAQAGYCCFQLAASSHATTAQVSARARNHSTPRLTIIAYDRCCSAPNTARAAPASLGPPCTTARTQRFSLSCRTSHTVPTARGGLAARLASFFFFFRVPTLFLAGRSFFLLASRCAARRARPHARTAVLSFYLIRVALRAAPARMHASSLAHTPTTDGQTTRRAVRRRG